MGFGRSDNKNSIGSGERKIPMKAAQVSKMETKRTLAAKRKSGGNDSDGDSSKASKRKDCKKEKCPKVKTAESSTQTSDSDTDSDA